MHFINDKNERYDGFLVAIALISSIRILMYIFFGLSAVGHIDAPACFGIFLNILMYFSIFKYSLDFFKFEKNVSLEFILIRYSAMAVASSIAARDGNFVIYILIVLMVMLVPYLAGSLTKPKKSVIILSLVLVITITISVIRIINPIDNYVYGLFGKWLYYLDCCNCFVQWLMFTTLYLLRAKIAKDNEIIK